MRIGLVGGALSRLSSSHDVVSVVERGGVLNEVLPSAGCRAAATKPTAPAGSAVAGVATFSSHQANGFPHHLPVGTDGCDAPGNQPRQMLVTEVEFQVNLHQVADDVVWEK